MAVIDYATCRHIWPPQSDETDEQYRQRCTQDGLARFTTKPAMKNLLAYRELTENAAKVGAHVVLVPEAEPQFRERPSYAFDVEAAILGPDSVITRQQYANTELRALLEKKAKDEGRKLAIEGDGANVAAVQDSRVITISPRDARDPEKWAEARSRAIKARKPLRISGGGF